MVARSVKEFSKSKFAFQCEGWKDSDKVWKSFKSCIAGETDKQFRSVLVVASGMGDGKSRLLHELVGLWSPLWHDEKVPKGLTEGLTENAKKRLEFTNEENMALFNVVELRVNFENDTRLRSDELVAMGTPKERKERVNKILLDRLLYPMLVSETAKTDFETFQKNKWDFTCDNLVTDVQQLFSEGNTKNVLVVLLIDGIHNLDEAGGKSYTSDLKTLLEVVSDLIQRVKYRFVACSSTMPLSVEKAMAGSPLVRRTVVSPPVLTKLPDEIDNEVVRKYAPQFLTMFGNHPRSMELLLSNGGTTVKAVFESAVRGLAVRYNIASLRNEELKDLLRISFSPWTERMISFSPWTEERLLVGERSLADVMRGGLMRIREGRLAISPLYLMIELKHAIAKGDGSVTEHPLFGWQPFGHGHEGDFEKYVAWVRCLRSRVFEGEVTIERLHHGVQWVSPQPNISISSTPLELCAAAHQVHTASKGKARTISDKKRMKKKRIKDWKVASSDAECVDPLQACIVNAKGAAAGDVFSSVKTSAGVRLNEVIQAKAWLGGKEELPTDEVLKNAKASASRGDLYLLVTRNTVTDTALEQLQAAVRNGVHVGVVRNENFNEYYGPFAGTFLHETSMHILSFHLPVFSMSARLMTCRRILHLRRRGGKTRQQKKQTQQKKKKPKQRRRCVDTDDTIDPPQPLSSNPGYNHAECEPACTPDTRRLL